MRLGSCAAVRRPYTHRLRAPCLGQEQMACSLEPLRFQHSWQFLLHELREALSFAEVIDGRVVDPREKWLRLPLP